MIKKILTFTLIVYVSSLQSQVIFSDDFNDGNANGWTITDNDNDAATTGPVDYNHWYVASTFASLVANSDGAAAISHSQAFNGSAWVAFNPNNFLISSPIDLTNASPTDLKLKFDAGSGQLPGGHAEHYAVYVTTSNTVGNIELATPVFSETLPSSAASVMISHVIDISAYAGQIVYISFRHYNCTNEFNLLIDNVIVEQVLPNNASIKNLELNRYSLTNVNNTLNINVTNESSSPITSITIDWNDGVSHSSTITGLNIAPFTTERVSHPTPVNYSNILEETINTTITNVNGVLDTVLTGNSDVAYINTVSSHINKNVVFEEGTGTWCQGCPGGIVMMMNMHANHPNDFIGIAVHTNDIMAFSEYQDSSDFVSVPTFHADRKLFDQDIFDSEIIYDSLVQSEVPALLTTSISRSGSNVTIDATATFNTVFSNANFRLGVIITEDSVTGTTSAYNQANVYSGGSFGPMGGYELLPDPVPANQMVYDHVARTLISGYNGQINSVPATITDGQIVNYSFNYTVPSGNNINKLHAILVLIDQNTGEIVNAQSESIGLATGISENKIFKTLIYPNPTSNQLNISFAGEGSDYLISIYDITGKSLLNNTLKNQSGTVNHQVMLNTFKKGIYFITISTKGKSSTKKIVVK